MIKILVIDTQGPAFTSKFAALLPGITLRGHEPAELAGTPCQVHGAFCTWLAAIPLVGAAVPAEVVAIRVFNEKAGWAATFPWLLAQIRAECRGLKPGDRIYTSRSWGAWDEDSAWVEQAARADFAEFVTGFRALQAEFKIVDFGAAGNEDKNDADNDIAFPQRDLVDRTAIIGARDRAGITMPWSGDGKGVSCVMWGDRIYSPDLTGAWRLWSGTSAATPKAAGAAAALGYTFEQFNRHLVTLPSSCRPAGDWVLPHPKWGWGDFEDAWQNQVRRVPISLLPPSKPLIKVVGDKPVEQPIEFHDFREVHDEEASDGAAVDQPGAEAGGGQRRGGAGRRKKG